MVGGDVFETWPRRGQAGSDYFCDRCGYNLHGQWARVEPTTQVMMLRCPECGAFHPAVGASTVARLWVDRLGRAALVTWLFLAYWCIGVLVIVHTGLMDAGLQFVSQRALLAGPAVTAHPGPVAAVAGASFGLGLVAAAVGAVVFPHWKWWSLVVAAFAWPGLSAAVEVVWITQFSLMRYVANYAEYVALFAGACVAGGLVGAAVARPAGRLLVRVVLPARARRTFTHLYRETAGTLQRA